jgi:hypothetical protein
MTYEFALKDHIVVRQESTGEERFGIVTLVLGSGAAVVDLPKNATFKLSSRLIIEPNGETKLGMFTLIKHVPYAEVTGKVTQ